MMEEERHKCKLCSRSFSNGRALGGHMKVHLATLPLPPKTTYNNNNSVCFSCSSSSDSEQEKQTQESLIYTLRENPKKSFRLADPEFSPDTASVVLVQDRESETESKNPTRQRSKRTRKSTTMLKLSFVSSEPEPVSSVSDTSPEENVAMCLMMLSRDTWNLTTNAAVPPHTSEIKFKKLRGKHLCNNCGKAFRSSRALASHRSICFYNNNNNTKVFECPFCYKVFGSGQALGGHKRSHLIPSSSSMVNDSAKLKQQSLIDLNLPAPVEDDNLSVVSDA